MLQNERIKMTVLTGEAGIQELHAICQRIDTFKKKAEQEVNLHARVRNNGQSNQAAIDEAVKNLENEEKRLVNLAKQLFQKDSDRLNAINTKSALEARFTELQRQDDETGRRLSAFKRDRGRAILQKQPIDIFTKEIDKLTKEREAVKDAIGASGVYEILLWEASEALRIADIQAQRKYFFFKKATVEQLN